MIRPIADENYGRGIELYKIHNGWTYSISPTVGLSESIYKIDVQTHGLYDHRPWNSKGRVENWGGALQGITITISLFWIQVSLWVGRNDT